MMTREEAVRFAEHAANMTDIPEVKEFYRLSAAALRPVSREQVEKVFSGCALCNWGGLDYVGLDGDGIYLNKPPKDEKFRFCPACGKPMTDEAEEMMLERWKEALGDET